MSHTDAKPCAITDAPFDPAKWVCAALLSGIRVQMREDGWFVVDTSEAETADVILFMGWLGGHHREVAGYLAALPSVESRWADESLMYGVRE